MRITEHVVAIPAAAGRAGLAAVRHEVEKRLAPGAIPIRFAVASSDDETWHCEIGVAEGLDERHAGAVRSIFEVRRRTGESPGAFTTVLVIPTGLGSEIGGHAGDAMPVAALLAQVSDTLVTHPNVLNGSDIMELPPNGLYVEGSVLSRMLAGTAGLREVRANRVLPVVDRHTFPKYENAAVNSVSAARASFGLRAPEVVTLDPATHVRSSYTPSGRAVGEISGLEPLLELLDDRRGTYDAVALTSQVEVPLHYHVDYYAAHGTMVNPWGGAEAILTHTLSSLYDVPVAHAPMLESKQVEDLDLGVVDARMAAEVISTAFFVCVLKGLHHSPQVVPLDGAPRPDALAVEDVSCLVIPDRVLGIPTLAALEQGIPVIAVRENGNVLRNDLAQLPWQPGQLQMVENYWEAAGVIAALRAGVEPGVVRRPLPDTRRVVHRGTSAASAVSAASDGQPVRTR